MPWSQIRARCGCRGRVWVPDGCPRAPVRLFRCGMTNKNGSTLISTCSPQACRRSLYSNTGLVDEHNSLWMVESLMEAFERRANRIRPDTTDRQRTLMHEKSQCHGMHDWCGE